MASQFRDLKKILPSLGVGLGLRPELAEQTLQSTDRIDWLEIISEQYVGLGGKTRQRLEQAASVFSLIPHGVSLSLGSTDDLNREYLLSLKKLLDVVDPPWWSDHLCFSSFGGVYMHDLLPLPFSKEAVKHVAERARIVQETIERPFLIENITFYMRVPGSEMTEAQFISEVIEQADCGLLLDINNVYVNSLNHKFDPFAFIDQIPLERTVQIHLAGHKHAKQFNAFVDTHGAPVIEPVFELLTHVLKRVEVKAILLERDQNFPDDFDDLLAELDEIREIVRQSQPELLKSKADLCRSHESNQKTEESEHKSEQRKQFVSAGKDSRSHREH